MTEPAVLELRSVSAGYGPVQVLFDVDLEVREGETVALLGANGAGKSTLLNVVSGLMPCTTGAVNFKGSAVTGQSPERRSTLGIVQVIGQSGIFPPLSVVDNLRAGAYRYPRHDARRRIERAFDRFPTLASKRRSRAGDLSGGQQHLLALAVALVHDPELLLIDELSLGLAPVMVDHVLDIVRELKDDGLTMVVVEQSAEQALRLADRAVFMEKGAVGFDGPSAELSGSNLLRAVFLRGGEDR